MLTISGQYIKICGEDSRRRLPRPLLEKLCLLETPLYLREILVEEPLEEGSGGTIFDSYLIWWIENIVKQCRLTVEQNTCSRGVAKLLTVEETFCTK